MIFTICFIDLILGSLRREGKVKIMSRLLSRLLGVATVVIGLGSAPHAHGELLKLGTTYSLQWNFGNVYGSTLHYSTNLILTQATQTFTGTQIYHITESTTPLGGNREFVEFYVTTASGAPLVQSGSLSKGFAIRVAGIQLTQIATENDAYFDFVTNGSVNTGIGAWSGLGVHINPNPGSIGAGQEAFYFQPPSPHTSNLAGYRQYQYPFDYSVAYTNIDPRADGYVFGFELTAPTPAPGTGVFGLAALVLAGVVTRARGFFAR